MIIKFGSYSRDRHTNSVTDVPSAFDENRWAVKRIFGDQKSVTTFGRLCSSAVRFSPLSRSFCVTRTTAQKLPFSLWIGHWRPYAILSALFFQFYRSANEPVPVKLGTDERELHLPRPNSLST